MATPLADATVKRITRLFSSTDRDLVSALLIEECGDNLPLAHSDNPAHLERIRIAVLKLSDGDLNRLHQAIEWAQTDWRDVLVAAGFGSDLTAHTSWWPDGPA